MNGHLSKKQLLFILCVFSFFIGIFVFGYIIKNNVWSDIQDHSQILADCLDKEYFPNPPLYYFLVYLFSFFQPVYFNTVAVFVLAVAVSLKALFSFKAIEDITSGINLNNRTKFLFTLLLLFVFPIIYQSFDFPMYLGKISPNVWHNSTAIAVMPFVVLLFMLSLRLIKFDTLTQKDLGFAFLFGVLNILIKPSFLFAFVPAFFVLMLLRDKSISYIVRGGIFLFALFLVILLQYWIIYIITPVNPDNQFTASESGTTIVPFFTYNYFHTNNPLNLLSSLLFPLVCILFYYKEALRSVAFQFSVLILFFAYIFGALFVETGPRMYHANMLWQLHMSNYLLFLVSCSFLLLKMKEKGIFTVKNVVLSLLFAAHIISGFIYLYKYLILGNFK